MHRKGIDRDVADEALTEIDDDSERDRARELVGRRLRSLPVGTREQAHGLAGRIGLCGDGWSAPSKVESAWRSGDALGRALAAVLPA